MNLVVFINQYELQQDNAQLLKTLLSGVTAFTSDPSRSPAVY